MRRTGGSSRSGRCWTRARSRTASPSSGTGSGVGIEEGWEIERLHADPVGDAGKTEDAEAVTRQGGWIYIFGSHFGGKNGPLQPKRGFVARFREAEVEHVTDDPAMAMEISRRSFALHRLINDALKERGPDLIPLGPKSHEALIAATIERGEQEGKKWAGLVREDDYPINVEGAAFRDGTEAPEGGSPTLLLGLRFPVTAEGHPIVVEIEGIERLFEPGDRLPEVRGFWTVDAVGREGTDRRRARPRPRQHRRRARSSTSSPATWTAATRTAS